VKVYVGDVAPVISLKVPPPLVDRCHCTLGSGAPAAAARKLTDAPGLTVWSAGSVLTVGASLTRIVRV
jgi:hypothetical protein